jgi:hypothetical protein
MLFRECRSLVESCRVGAFDVRFALARCIFLTSGAGREWRAVEDFGRSGEDNTLSLPLPFVRIGELRWPRVCVDEAFSLPPCSCSESKW